MVRFHHKSKKKCPKCQKKLEFPFIECKPCGWLDERYRKFEEFLAGRDKSRTGYTRHSSQDGKNFKRYQLKCNKCGYYWDTKYAKIPARCPACGGKIFGTNNYSILKEYKED